MEAGKSTLVGSHTQVLKDEGASQEVQVVDVRAEGRRQSGSQCCISGCREGIPDVHQRALHRAVAQGCSEVVDMSYLIAGNIHCKAVDVVIGEVSLLTANGLGTAASEVI